jgi:Flp pilus assembly protein TadG
MRNEVMIEKKLLLQRRLFDLFSCETGQALAETSLTIPFFLLVLLGSVDLARAAYTGIEVTNAARAAVQYAAQNSATAADTSAIQNAASADGSSLSGLTTSVSVSGICSDGSSCSGTGGSCYATDCSGSHIETILTVDSSATFAPMFPMPGIPSALTMHGHAVQKVLNN